MCELDWFVGRSAIRWSISFSLLVPSSRDRGDCIDCGQAYVRERLSFGVPVVTSGLPCRCSSYFIVAWHRIWVMCQCLPPGLMAQVRVGERHSACALVHACQNCRSPDPRMSRSSSARLITDSSGFPEAVLRGTHAFGLSRPTVSNPHCYRYRP